MASNIIWPEDLNTLSDDDITRLTAEIRERRSKISATLKNAKNAMGRISDVRLRAALDKELLKFTKKFEKADKAISDLEKSLSSIMAVRLQLEDINAGPAEQ